MPPRIADCEARVEPIRKEFFALRSGSSSTSGQKSISGYAWSQSYMPLTSPAMMISLKKLESLTFLVILSSMESSIKDISEVRIKLSTSGSIVERVSWKWSIWYTFRSMGTNEYTDMVTHFERFSTNFSCSVSSAVKHFTRSLRLPAETVFSRTGPTTM